MTIPKEDSESREQVFLRNKQYRKNAGYAAVLLALSAWTLWSSSRGTKSAGSSNCEVTLKKDPSTLLAYRQSYGYFDDIPDDEWVTLKQKVAREARHYEDNADSREKVSNTGYWNAINQQPVFSCPNVVRLGGFEDGAKWTCDLHRLQRVVAERKKSHSQQQSQPKAIRTDKSATEMVDGQDSRIEESHCLVYSIGSNGNYMFEEGLHDLLGGPICEIHIFDFGQFARDEEYLKQRNFHYHAWGLKSSALTGDGARYNERMNPNNAYTFYSFNEIRKKLGHENRTIDIFKIDCEGCEWHTFEDWINVDIRQILIETHFLPFAEEAHGNLPAMPASKYFNSFEQHGFVMFYKELNGYALNCCSEWSYIKLHPSFLDETWATPDSVNMLEVVPGIDAATNPVMDSQMRRQFGKTEPFSA